MPTRDERGKDASLAQLSRWSTFCFLLLSATCEAARTGAGLGADCLLPISTPDLPPVFGTCRTFGSDEVEAFSFQAKDTEISKWIILWNDHVNGTRLSTAACSEAVSVHANATFNGTCTKSYTDVIKGIAIELDSGNLAAFLTAYNESVASVHEDSGVAAADMQYNPPWSLDRLDQPFLPYDDSFAFDNLATDVYVYVIDTGIRATHSEFRYIDGRPGSRASEVYTSLSSGTVGQDCNGHGTHVAGTVGGLTYGPAKNVTLLAVRSLECLGNGTVSQVIDGLDWIRANHLSPAVAVLALGGEAQYALDLAVHNLVGAGIPVLVAAGNDDQDACNRSPGREPLALTVAATTRLDERLWISPGTASNYGSCVHVWAPGTNIQSASAKSDTATEYRSGTSQSAPFVAGAIALYLQNQTGATPDDLKSAVSRWGLWGQLYESPQSSPNGSHVLNFTNDVMLGLMYSVPLSVEPSRIVLDYASLDPISMEVKLEQAITSAMTVDVSLSSPQRGSVYPTQLKFDPSDWQTPQYISLNTSGAALLSADSSVFTVNFLVNSEDETLHGQELKAWVSDKKGNNFTYPKVVPSLPFTDYANTYFFDDTFNLSCSNGGGGSASRDVVYYFVPSEDCLVNISLCNTSNTTDPLNTVLFLLEGLHANPVAYTTCNDDFCGRSSQLSVKLQSSMAYGFIVTGKDNHFGTFRIDITSTSVVAGAIPDRDSLQQISSSIPASLYSSSSGGFGYVIQEATWQTGATPVGSTPPPPPMPKIGADPGPPAPWDLPQNITVPGGGSDLVQPAAPGGPPTSTLYYSNAPPGTFQIRRIEGPSTPPSSPVSASSAPEDGSSDDSTSQGIP